MGIYGTRDGKFIVKKLEVHGDDNTTINFADTSLASTGWAAAGTASSDGAIRISIDDRKYYVPFFSTVA